MTTKIFPSFTKSMDAETGIVEAYVSIMGIKDLDRPPDVIQMGAFVKTIQERGPQGARKIRVLHQHWYDSVIGVPLTLVEHPRELLPEELLAVYPEATGGLFARTQFVMDVQLGRETYALYKAGAMDEWSIGFDALQFEYIKSEEEADTHRLLKEIKLWEYSPVTWGMNPGTVTTGVKDDRANDSCRRHSADPRKGDFEPGGFSASGRETGDGEEEPDILDEETPEKDGQTQRSAPTDDEQDDNADEERPTSHDVGTSLGQLEAAPARVEPQAALTREMAMKLKQLEIDLAMRKSRSRRQK